jgi:hypothetical protein
LDLDNFLKKAKKNIDIFGITLEETTGSFINTIESKLRSPEFRKIRIILYNPNATLLIEKINQMVDSDIGTIQTSLNCIMESRSRVGNDGKKLEVKVFDGVPIQGYIFPLIVKKIPINNRSYFRQSL